MTYWFTKFISYRHHIIPA